MDKSKEDILPYCCNDKSKPKILSLVPNEITSRYKTPQLQAQQQGKNKMIRTVFTNIKDVSKAMQVPPEYIVQWIGYEQGVKPSFDAKKPERDQAHISGETDTKEISRAIHNFILHVLLCPKCGLPEVLLEPEGKQIMGSCRACGGRNTMNIPHEKFVRFVINHPPTGKGFAGNKKQARQEEKKKKQEEEKKEKQEEEKLQKEKEKEEKEKKKSSKEKKKEEEVVWFTDTSSDALEKRKQEMVPDTLREKSAWTIEEVKNFIEKNDPQGLHDLYQERNSSPDQILPLIFDSCISPDLKVLKHLFASAEKNQEFFTPFCKGSPEAQEVLCQILGFYCYKVNKNFLPELPLIFKWFYDQELIDEENILSWHTQIIQKKPKDKVALTLNPFIQWLKTAEEEGSDDEEEEEEEEEEDDE